MSGGTSVEKELLQYIFLSKVLTGRMLDFAAQEGILDIISSTSRFTSREFLASLSKKLGYRLSEAPRQRMALVLLDFLSEAGVVREGPADVFRHIGVRSSIEEIGLSSNPPILDGEHREREILHDKQLAFFTLCLENAPDFLRGGGYAFSFSSESSPVWAGFLGSSFFRLLRNILLRFMGVEDRPEYRMLDLCHGPGYGIRDILGWYPQIKLVATDYDFACDERVIGKVDSFKRPALIDDNWRGFVDPLPYDSGSLDAVHFTFADPYIPSGLREGFYREVLRVLKPGGVLGTLGWGYPDKERTIITERWVRQQILAHDFAESVCEGWRGFHDIGETRSLFARVGFTDATPLFNENAVLASALRVLEKAR